MLAVIGVDTLDQLATAAVPASILDEVGAGFETLPTAVSEHEALDELRALAQRNTVTTSMIGLGYYDTLTPAVIRRNVLESPAWYTAYTPYQPEISQGRLEALLNFQTMVTDLTGMELANSSMLDEATAAAEAMTLLRRAGKSSSPRFVVDADALPQTKAVLTTRAEPLGIELVEADLATGELPDGEFFGVLAQLPGASGHVVDLSALITTAHDRGALV
ncbi:MAG: glycine dehydrogenase (aminomethyl-transferring), partial [Actinomycetota bacterium]|nr:glycine dehydrogenase (aminomethyl-transferring) [Actinomycetota bacterium]